MSRLIVISNRVSAPKGEAGAQGGLAVAFAAALRENRGIWFGWSGVRAEAFTGKINFQRTGGVTTATIDLAEEDVEEYYNGFANRTLWPLLHFRIDLAEFDRGFADAYARVNTQFAETICPLIEADDLVWVQDYHLIPLGHEMRQRGLENRLGFFLHTPWPPRHLLTSLPRASELVATMFAYDVVGFHTEEWLDAFLDFVVEEMGAIAGEDGEITLDGRTIRAIACPIGIDTADFVAAASSPTARLAYRRMKDMAGGRDMMIGVDRLDYSKGLEERFLGYERFLQDHEEQRKEVFLLQIAPPSRGDVPTYQQIRDELDQLSGRINGAYSDLDWTPIRYVNQGYPRPMLAGVYRAARIALVTPLRDGMNLVAKEYVAAQDPDDPGVLILSRFAGAAQQMTDAVLVNPYSAEEVSDAICAALAMPLHERRERWRKLMDGISQEDVVWWRKRFTDALMAPGQTLDEVEPDEAERDAGDLSDAAHG
jgi:trehalose 6-phosphate synthase